MIKLLQDMNPIQMWEVPCLGGKFSEKQLNSMDAGIWEYIAVEMKDNPRFLNAFKHNIVVNDNSEFDYPDVVDVDAPISDVISHDGEKTYLTSLPADGNLVKPLNVSNVVADLKLSRYYKYDSIIPSSIPDQNTNLRPEEIKRFKSMGIKLENDTYDDINDVIDAYKSLYFPSLKSNNYYSIDGYYIPETELHKHIVFLVCSCVLDAHVIFAYLPELSNFISLISRSKYLSTAVLIEIGWLLDWKFVRPELYNKRIVETQITRVDKKIALYMGFEVDVMKDYQVQIDKLIIEYLERKNELLEQITQREFIAQKTNVGLSNVKSFEDEYAQMMYDDDYMDGEDAVDVIQNRKKNLGMV